MSDTPRPVSGRYKVVEQDRGQTQGYDFGIDDSLDDMDRVVLVGGRNHRQAKFRADLIADALNLSSIPRPHSDERGIHVSELIDDVRRDDQANDDAEKAHPCPPTKYIGIDYGSEPPKTVAVLVEIHEGNRVVHIVTGTPSAVVAEWERLAAEDRKPS
jgi:hypothetical protein